MPLPKEVDVDGMAVDDLFLVHKLSGELTLPRWQILMAVVVQFVVVVIKQSSSDCARHQLPNFVFLVDLEVVCYWVDSILTINNDDDNKWQWAV